MGWQVEVQCEAGRLPGLLPGLIESGAPVVVDHFGRPDAELGIEDPGFRHLLRSADSGKIYVKLSGAYRVGAALADKAAPLLLKAFGHQRLLWGSDWPHTQFERIANPISARQALDRWVPDAGDRAAILSQTPAGLFGFLPAERPSIPSEIPERAP
jgi:predicted TIM-barrel fold metal-dependent hydrolase